MIDKMRDITYDIINCAIEVHRSLGPGLLESVYQKALVHEFKLRNFEVESELSIKKQLLTYLKLLDIHVGLLINFNVCQLREGITRIVNNYDD